MLRSFAAGLFLLPLSMGASAPPPTPTPGDYHEGTTLDCGDCHVMHPRPAEGPSSLAPGPRVGELLREDVNDLCLACHDDSPNAADVLGPNSGSRPGDVRQAGALNRLGRGGVPSTGHTLDSLAVAPGSSPPWSADRENGAGNGLNCINCHAPHGGGHAGPTYRNLRDDAGNNLPGQGLVTYNHGAPGLNDLTRDVFVRRALDYDESAVDFNEPDPRDSAIGRFCAGCHTDFHGAPGSAQIGGEREGDSVTAFLRHPVAGVDIGAARGGRRSKLSRFASLENRVKVMSELGRWDAPGSDVTLTCISCHKAHGNDNPFGLIYRSGHGRIDENGDSGGGTLEALCGQCHAETGGR